MQPCIIQTLLQLPFGKQFIKSIPKVKFYRNYKHFDIETFKKNYPRFKFYQKIIQVFKRPVIVISINTHLWSKSSKIHFEPLPYEKFKEISLAQIVNKKHVMKHALNKVWIAAKSNKSIIFQKELQATLVIWTLRIYLVIESPGKTLDLIFIIKD